jgi:recombination protein RecA
MSEPKKEKPPQGIVEFSKAANKRYGAGAIMSASHVRRVAIPRIPTGVWLLDKGLGGGLPVGRISQLYGWESSGKTTRAMRALAYAQRMCGNCHRPAELGPGEVITIDPNTGEVEMVESMVVTDCICGKPRNIVGAFIDQEGTWDSKWAAANGVFEERLLMSWPEFAEEAVDIVEGLILSDSADIIVLDSVAAMSPSVELEDSAANFSGHPGMHARIMGNALRKWNGAIQKKNREAMQEDAEYHVPSIWLINQLREKIGVKFGNPETKPGGNAIKFFTSVEVRLSAHQYKTDDKLMETYHVEMGFKVSKNKTAPARQAGKYKMAIMDHGEYVKGQIMDQKDVLFHAMRHGLVEKVSDRKYIFAGDTYVGVTKLIEYWATTPDVYEEVKRIVLQMALEDD